MSGINTYKTSASISAYLKLFGDVALSSSLVAVVDQNNNISPLQLATASIGLVAPTFLALPTWTNTLGTKDGFSSQQTVAVASVGTGVFRLIRNAYTINNTAAQTGSVTGYFLNATETLLNGITHNLMDLQVGGVSKFFIANNGQLNVERAFGIKFIASSVISAVSNGNIIFQNNAGTDFNRLQLGGTTSSFPSIKRSGNGVAFKLADDSAFCGIEANNVLGYGSLQTDGLGMFGGIGSASASAILQANSTTKGFLMPRMTQAQILAIVSPAAGLMVFNTDLQKPCFYDATAPRWERVSSSAM
jgi:hypothetical protein